MADRESLVIKAKLAEQAERYDDMVAAMKSVAEADSPLSSEERNLLSVAYKNIIGTRRIAWRTLSAIEGQSRSDSQRIQYAKEYRESIEVELRDICNTVCSLLDDHLVKNAEDVQSKVFYYKMKGDYCRYEAEFSTGDEKDKAAQKSQEAYSTATETANEENLYPCHPIRLGLALNYSVFYYEILGDKAKACDIAKKAFDDAVSGPPDDEELLKDSTLILQLLRDNLTLWSSDEDLEDDSEQN